MSGSWTWPATAAGGELGDGRFAIVTDRPGSAAELAAAIAQRTAEGLAVYPQGGRTALDYGGLPSRPGVALCTTGLARVIDYPHADMTITVEAGMTLDALQSVLAEHRQRVPLEASAPDRATIGGIWATQTCGPRRFGMGRPRDLIIGVSFATCRGEILKGGGRVVKNVAGYDFPKLLTGSMGTLGVITQVTLKVRPIPETSALVWATYSAAQEALDALGRLNVSCTRPVALELLTAGAARTISGAMELPTDRYVLVVGFEDNADSVAWQVERVRPELDAQVMDEICSPSCDAVWRALAEYPALPLGLLSIQAHVPPSAVVSFLEELDPARWSAQAHAGDGIIHAHAIADESLESIAAELGRLRSLARVAGGSVILPRCPAAWKEKLPIWGDPRQDWSLARKVKATLDPTGLLNPGRFVDAVPPADPVGNIPRPS